MLLLTSPLVTALRADTVDGATVALGGAQPASHAQAPDPRTAAKGSAKSRRKNVRSMLLQWPERRQADVGPGLSLHRPA
jgi:hypothetical protein